ncbi:MAG: hypothetical protein A3B70_07340 [Deltaproteobacteria bacterium RIFCSPHIGHO2_02_FULL_40_11]|nr:MAG: hypothetical protein A3B70_07340 [Deltaproteobacteria bacterium RIFCSPHIGHO2_02_FULL_40_11]
MFKTYFEKIINRKSLTLLGISLLIAGLIYTLKKEKIPPKQNVYVEVTYPKLGNIEEELSATGNIEAMKEALLSSKTGGRVQTVHVEEGQLVQEGTLLVKLEAKELELQKQAAESAKRSAASHIDEENYKRHKILYEEGIISKAEFDKIEAQYKSAQAETERLGKQVNLQEEQVASSEITAPFRAIAAKVFVHEGENVAPGQPIAQLMNMEQVTVTVPVVSKDIEKIKLGQKAKIRVDASSDVFEGNIHQISQVADPITRTFDVKIKVQNTKNILKPGMFAKAWIVTHEKNQTLIIPKTALVKREDLTEPHIYTVQDQKAHLQKVKLGIETQTHVEIQTPIPLSWPIVTAGQSQLYEGAPVQIVPQNEVH